MFSFTATADEVLAGVALTGRTAVVTGASSGIGLQTAKALASAGANLALPVRDPATFEASDGYAKLAAWAERIELVAMDLGSLASVRQAATQIKARHPRIDILINNAGVMFTPPLVTSDGFEYQFGINHLGPFLLTTLLVPNLRAASGDDRDARVVTLSSDAHRFFGAIDVDDVNFERRDYDPFAAYGQSKSANVLMTVELQRRFGDHGITALAVHPGTVMTTKLSRHMNGDMVRSLMTMAGDTFTPENVKSEAQGAATAVWAATAPSLRAHGGAFLVDCQLSEASPEAVDPDTARRLWEMSERWAQG